MGGVMRMSAVYQGYVPIGATAPSAVTSPLASYAVFTGSEVSWKDLSFFTGSGFATPLNGVTGFNLSINNNLTPDPSMNSGPGQQVYYVNMNAGTPMATLSVSFTANPSVSGNHMNYGDQFAVVVDSGAGHVGSVIHCNSLLIDGERGRQVGTGRQMRNYSGRLLSVSNDPISGLPVRVLALS